MDAVNWFNLLCYITVAVLCAVMLKRKLPVPAVIFGTLALHGLVFNAFYIYRDLAWAACPPMCGLQEWAPILRTHSLIAILLAILDRLMLAGNYGH